LGWAKRPKTEPESSKELCISLEEIPKSGREIPISLKEIPKWAREIGIFLEKIPISSGELGKWTKNSTGALPVSASFATLLKAFVVGRDKKS